MLEKEVRVSATDGRGFGSFADTHILRVKNEDLEDVSNALMNANVKVIAYPNAGLAYAEDLAEKTLVRLVDMRATEQADNGLPMSTNDRILAEEAIYNNRARVGNKFYEAICENEMQFAKSMVEEIIDSSHKVLPIDECVKIGALTPGILINKLDEEAEDQGDIEDLLEDELCKSAYDNEARFKRFAITQEDECCCNGSACKKVVLC